MIRLGRRKLAAQTLPAAGTACTDRELLLQFVGGQDPAFTLLVERHAGLVMGVCRRILRQAADAEDAFQATFLVLARRASSLQWQESIAGWLHQTARRTALKLRSLAARRRRAEADAVQTHGEGHLADLANPSSSIALQELVELLDAELSNLPAKFREVIVLSQIEGLGREELAARLGITAAAVKDRLERGREQLRLRLVRRGITLTATALAAWLLPQSAQAAGQTALTASTAQAATVFATGAVSAGNVPTAVALAQGVLKMMGLEKLKSLALGLVSLLTVGTIAYGMLQDDPERFDKGLLGDVVAVNLSGKVPTVTVKLDGDVLLNLDINPQAKVWTAYEPGKLADLQPERFVSLRLGSDHRTVQEIHVLGLQREVTIRAVTPSGALTVVDGHIEPDEEFEDGPPPTFEFQLAKDAIVRISGLPATSDDLKPGMHVPLEFGSDGKTVNAIEADIDESLILEGDLLEVHAGEKLLKIRTLDEDEVIQIHPLNVLSDTLILLDGKPATLDQLAPGSDIRARLHEGKTSIRSLSAVTPEIEMADDAAAGVENDASAETEDDATENDMQEEVPGEDEHDAPANDDDAEA